jgi:Tol biopolymer transport system component
MRIFFTLACVACALGAAAAQQPTANLEIYLVALNMDVLPVVTGSVVNISNSPGYDNQPSFVPDGSALLFSSQRDGQQNDIYRYDIASKRLTQLTHTTEREYSPLVTPDQKTFSVVRVEADGTQRLWRFNLDGSMPQVVLENVKPVGYHVWINATQLALFILGAQGQPATLQIADTTTGKAEVIETGIGRSLHVHPGPRTVSFISKPADRAEHWTVKEVDPRTRDVSLLTDTVDQNMSEDLAWHPSGALLMSSGTKLFARRPGNPDWREVADLSASTGRVTRLAISPDGKWLAFVAESKGGTTP